MKTSYCKYYKIEIQTSTNINSIHERLRRDHYKLPTFHGKSRPREYKTCENEIMLVFAFHNHDDGKKATLVITSLLRFLH